MPFAVVTQMHLWIIKNMPVQLNEPLLWQVLAPCELLLIEDERSFFLIMTSLKIKSKSSAQNFFFISC